jgi:TonB family protein
VHTVGLILMAAASWPARAQGVPRDICVALRDAPARDSISLLVALSVRAFDTRQSLPAAYQMDFGEAVRRHLVLPRPLGADLYEVSREPARIGFVSIWGNYAATITAGGRVTNAIATGGDHNPAFDVAVVAAMQAIDSTDVLSMVTAGLPRDDVDIRVAVTTHVDERKQRAMAIDRVDDVTIGQVLTAETPQVVRSDSQSTVPLFAFRTALRKVTQLSEQVPGTGLQLQYPYNLRQANIEGEVRTAFVIGADGLAEPASVQISRATHLDFAKAVVEALSSMKFVPTQVEGCAVRSLVVQPFTFSLIR